MLIVFIVFVILVVIVGRGFIDPSAVAMKRSTYGDSQRMLDANVGRASCEFGGAGAAS